MSTISGRSGGSRPRRPRFECLRIDRLPARTARQEIVAGLFAPGEIVGLIGPPKSAKSYVALELAAAIAQERPFLGRSVRRGATIIIAAERYSEWRRRIEAAVQPLPTAMYLISARPMLADLDEVDELVATIEAAAQADGEPVALVVIDTIARCMRGLDQNSSRDMGLVADGLTRIVETIATAAVLIVHHTSKGGTDMRGSSALLGALDLELLIGGSGEDRKLTVTNANAVADGQVLPFRFVASAEGEPLRIAPAGPLTPTDRASETSEISKPLRGDPLVALSVLRDLAIDGSAVSVSAWSEAVRSALNARKPRKAGALKTAYHHCRELLEERGVILIEGESVRISERQNFVRNEQISDGPNRGEGVRKQRQNTPPGRGGSNAFLRSPNGEDPNAEDERQILTFPSRPSAEIKPAGKA